MFNRLYETDRTSLRYHVPGEVMFTLVGVAMVAMGFASYQVGSRAASRVAALVMSLMVAIVTMMVVDLDRPARGFIQVPVLPLIETAQGIRQ